MLVLFIVLGVCLLFGAGFLLAAVVAGEQGRAKRRAREMLEKGEVDQREVDRVLKVLSSTEDGEGRRLYQRLADLKEGRR